MSEIERDKLSLQELKGFLGDHMTVKESMKYYFLLPGRDLVNGLLFLHDDGGCMKVSDYITEGGVGEIYVEYNGEEEEQGEIDSGSDFEDELDELMNIGSEEEPDAVITAEDCSAEVNDNVNATEQTGTAGEIIEHIFVPDVGGAITQVINSPLKQNVRVDYPTQSSQVLNVSQPCQAAQDISSSVAKVAENGSDSEDSEDYEYVPHTDDSGEESEVVEMRKHARKFRKKMGDFKMWADADATGAVPIDLVANVEEVVEDMEFESSDEDYSYDEDEDGNMVRRKSQFVRFNPDSDIPHFSLGMVFKSKKQLTRAMKRYGLATKRSISFLKSEEARVRAKCDWPGCPWMLYAAKTSRCSRFQIITFEDEHQCAQNRDNKLVTTKVIAKRYEHFILANPLWKIDSMKAIVMKDMFVDVSISKCKAAKKLVLDQLMSGMKSEYNKVFDYQLELLRSNPGSTVAVCLDPKEKEENIFQQFYVCFNAMKQGFKAGCRKVIGLDGCFFKGACQGELLAAIGRDANNQMYPVAWAVVEKETNESWAWFIGLLIKDLDINDQGAGWVFISDKQKGLINSMRDYLPKVEHRMCARHIYANWRKKHKDHQLQKRFWAIAKSANREDFNYNKAKLAQLTPEGAKDIMKTDPKHWARAFFPKGANCESGDNNPCESFNNAIIEARFHPIISQQEKIRKKLMVRVQEQKTKSEKWNGIICPNIFKKIKANIKRTQFLEVLWNGKDGFELAGLPCCHAICAIYKSGRKVEDFIDKCYYIDTFKKKYEHCLQPVEGEESWPMSQNPRPVAPGYIAMPGARKKNNDRKREEGEAPKGKKLSKHGIQITCGSCGGQGHNKTSCKKKGDNAKKRKSYLGKRGRKVRETEQAQTDASTSKAAAARASGPTRSQVAARSQSAARSQAAPSQVAASSQATTSRFIPPRSSSTTNNDVPRGSTTAVRGRGNGRGSVGGTGRGRGSETGFMAFFTASGNY
ncbi:uncharacterized protein [Aegilops tauschii subsp. strangulata]|uniref:CCHC-type domain-containing protein n=1 Tax=Aegilops tauschii subsp. strangulata TaxID=200361 RepID=A0A453RIC0_AEGTS|nr:uncharacterized protein LOC109756472 isoform X1 [Aegilops tauschii subsp. strangulata]XP_040251301.1 uncharacterized protein LOC109756472 isoform X1 [Aegilops tauschii subsp. strangulata]